MNALKKSIACVSVASAALVLSGGMASASSFTHTPAYLQLDKTVVKAGDTVNVFARCGSGEALNLVGSEAFTPTGSDGPYQGNGGVVPFTEQVDGGARGQTQIRADLSPGTYHVTERCGGGNAGGVDITVIPGI